MAFEQICYSHFANQNRQLRTLPIIRLRLERVGCSIFLATALLLLRSSKFAVLTPSRNADCIFPWLMTILDFIVIYLACGSPFAVHRLVVKTMVPSIQLFASASLRLIVWPVFALWALKSIIQGTRISRDLLTTDTERQLLEIRTKMEGILSTADRGGPSFEFREIFDRYTGLAGATSEHMASPAYEIYEIANHPNPEAANACLTRKNRSLIDLHMGRARTDISNFVRSSTASGTDELLRLAIQASEAVGDTLGRTEFGSQTDRHQSETKSTINDKAIEHWTFTDKESRSIALGDVRSGI